MIYVNLWQKNRWIFCDSHLEQVQALIFTIIKPAGLIIDLNFDSIAARSWSTRLAKNVETYQNYFKRPKTVCPTLKKWLFFIVFHVLERTEHGIIHGWRRRLNSHKLPSGEQIIIQVVGISHLARAILLFSYQFIEVS